MRLSSGETAQPCRFPLAQEAGALVADAVMPLASRAADVGEEVIDAVDDVTDAIEERVPGGGVINQVADLMLLPGRYVLKVVSPRVEREESEDGSAEEA